MQTVWLVSPGIFGPAIEYTSTYHLFTAASLFENPQQMVTNSLHWELPH